MIAYYPMLKHLHMTLALVSLLLFIYRWSLALAGSGRLQQKWLKVLPHINDTFLLLFGVLFAVNSSLHSYLIVSYAKEDGVSLDVGFYYMSNALGRLIGTLLSGWLYQQYGLATCLWWSSLFVLLAALCSLGLPRRAGD